MGTNSKTFYNNILKIYKKKISQYHLLRIQKINEDILFFIHN
jgi:hypothetical protein